MVASINDLCNNNPETLFINEDACLSLLARVKWEQGFICKNCGHTNSCPGKKPHSLRCTRCKHEESATANTIFHNVKFSICKAFYIAFEVCQKRQNVSSYEFARRLDLRQMTCWKFKEKVLKAIKIDTLDEKKPGDLASILLK